MESREIDGAAHIGRRASGVWRARVLPHAIAPPSLWHGLTWGLCLPLLVTADPAALIRAWLVSVPLGMGGLLATGALVQARLRRAGRGSAAEGAAYVLAPLGVFGASAVQLLLPLRALPVLLACLAVGLASHRMAIEIRNAERPLDPLRLEVAAFAVPFTLVFAALFDVRIIHDAFQYYGYLVSTVLDGDLNLYDQIYIHNAERFYNPFPRETARYIGTAVLDAPFFLAGHAASWIVSIAGAPVPRDGYGVLYGLFVTLGSSLFGLGGVVLSYRLAREWFSRWVAMAATLTVWLASGLPFFMFVWGGWAHPFALCLVAGFLLLWQRTRGERDRSLREWAALGALAGGMALVRPTSAIVLLFPLLEWIAVLGKRATAADRARALSAGPALAVLVALAVFSPQLSMWSAISGSWLAAPYREVGDFHDWLHPKFAGLLLATGQHGLFAWTPLLAVACAGLPLLVRRDRLVAAAAVASTAATFYLYASWSIWWTGIGFSNRFLLELTPVFVVGLGALLDAAARRVPREVLWGALVLAASSNLILIGAYRANEIPQGIPDPYRVVDDRWTWTRLGWTGLQHAPPPAAAPWTRWALDGYLTSRVAQGVACRDPAALNFPGATLLAAGLAAWFLVRALLAGSRRSCGAIAVLSVLGVTVVHAAIWAAAPAAPRFTHVHRLPISAVEVRRPAEDTHLRSEHLRPVTGVDLVSHLVYGHGIAQGDIVASVTVIDAGGREFERLLRAGIDTAEGSYPRLEHRETMRHGIDRATIARAVPTADYSRRFYEVLDYRAAFELPEPMVVREIRLRYVHPVGRLVLSDVFLRDF